MVKTVEMRFWEKVKKTDSCWLWCASHYKTGYGQFRIGGSGKRSAHRFSYAFHYGEIPPDKLVCHHCDVRSCVNPAHLYLGTAKQNTGDMLVRERYLKGEQKKHAKLNNQKVKEIREAYYSGAITDKKQLGRKYGVTHSTIRRIVRRTTWRHLP